MTKWEYILVSTSDLAEFVKGLNTYGAEGWEAISGAHCIGEENSAATYIQALHRSAQSAGEGPPLWVAVMKRPKP